MLVKTNVDISIKINHGIRCFVQMHRRGKSGKSASVGDRRSKFPCSYAAFSSHMTQVSANPSASARKSKNFDPWACAYACFVPVFMVK